MKCKDYWIRLFIIMKKIRYYIVGLPVIKSLLSYVALLSLLTIIHATLFLDVHLNYR